MFKKIFSEKNKNKALWNGEKGGKINFFNISYNKSILSYYREKENDKVVVLINLTDVEANVTISDDNLMGNYNNLFENENIIVEKNSKFAIKPYGFIILTKIN